MSLKFLGELGDVAESRGIFGAAVTCVPFDPTQSQAKLDVGFNRAVYSMVNKITLYLPTLHNCTSLSFYALILHINSSLY